MSATCLAVHDPSAIGGVLSTSSLQLVNSFLSIDLADHHHSASVFLEHHLILMLQPNNRHLIRMHSRNRYHNHTRIRRGVIRMVSSIQAFSGHLSILICRSGTKYVSKILASMVIPASTIQSDRAAPAYTETHAPGIRPSLKVLSRIHTCPE